MSARLPHSALLALFSLAAGDELPVLDEAEVYAGRRLTHAERIELDAPARDRALARAAAKRERRRARNLAVRK